MNNKISDKAFDEYFNKQSKTFESFGQDPLSNQEYDVMQLSWNHAVKWVTKFLCQKTDEAVGCDKCKHEGGAYCVGCYRQAPDRWESKTE